MKKILILLLFLITPLAVCADDSFYSMSIEEYSRLFEAGLLDDDEDEDIESEDIQEKKPVLKKKNKTDNDAIKLDNAPIELKIKKNGEIPVYKETYKGESAKNSLFESDKFKIYSDSSKELNKYMHNDLKTTMNATYKINNALDLNAGHEVWYVNQDATLGAKKVYINPRLNLTKRFYLDYTGKFNETNKDIEQEVGVNYKPKIFKDAASFGVKAGTTINDQKETQTGKLKFTTDFYLF